MEGTSREGGPAKTSSARGVARILPNMSERGAVQKRELDRAVAGQKSAEDRLRASQENRHDLLRKSLAMQAEVRRMARRIILAQEEERKRISRELHDVIGPTLTGINLRLAALKFPTTDPVKLMKNITEAQRLVTKSLETVNRFARDLRPALLDDLGLVPALHAFLKSFMRETGIRARLIAPRSIEGLGNQKKTTLYRVVLEALSNVDRHANASQVRVEIQNCEGPLVLEVADDGEGFNPTRPSADSRKRLGLVGMMERVEMLGGAWSLTSSPGKGTTIRVMFPRT